MNDESPLVDAQKRFIDAIPFRAMPSESRALAEALGRVLYEDVLSIMDSPPYHRAIAEGFAVNTADTEQASEASPVTFTVAGEVAPGDPACPPIARGQGVRVSTGSILPDDPVSVVRMWDCTVSGDSFTITRPFPPRFFIEDRGCEIARGEVLLSAGMTLAPLDLGNAAAQGLTRLPVAQAPTVALFSSGNEVIPHTEALRPGAIRDSNSVMLAAAVTAAGGIPRFYGIMRDEFETFVSRIKLALDEADMVVISGGTAAGGINFIADLLRAVGDLVVDGVPMRSGKPLIMGSVRDRPIVCVAGHPPEALRGFNLFGSAALNQLLGRQAGLPADNP
ncbi:MAG TPA: molybdopterin molybdotransferase MoeA [Gammaproteobacteria bacterium]|nr:molybdopterin molybdotransferase MoeA [Gammaproteobacteria bacterium]